MAGLFDAYPVVSADAVGTMPAAPKPPKGLFDAYPEVPTSVSQPRPASGVLESIQAGFQGSAPGLAWRRKLPDLVIDPQHAAWWERALSSATHVGSELGLMIPGAIAGGMAGSAVGSAVPVVGTGVGALLGAGAGMGAVPAAIRQTLIEAYKSGDVMTAADFWNSVREVAKVTATEAGVNAAAMGAGAAAKLGFATAMGAGPVASKAIALGSASMTTRAAQTAAVGIDLATQIAAMPTIPAALQGRLPDAQEFVDAAILIGGLKAAHVTASNITSVFLKTGKTPAEQVADAQANPDVAKEMAEPKPAASMEPEYVAPSRMEMLKVQENLFTETARLDEMAAKAEAAPLSDPERIEMNALKSRVLDLENQLRAGAPELSRTPTYTADQFVEARKQADTRLAELTTKADTEALTDTERAERVFLSNSLDRPSALAKHFGFEPILTERPTREAIDASAQRLHDDVLRQLKDADEARKAAGLEPLGDDHAEAVAALEASRIHNFSVRFGLLPENLFAERLAKIEDVNKLQGEPGKFELSDEWQVVPDGTVLPSGTETRSSFVTGVTEARRMPGADSPIPQPSGSTGPELDLFGEPIQPPPMESQNQVATIEPAMVPVAGLTLSKDVPQFKAGANAKGVVEPLGGAWDPTGVGPIQIWQRLNGAMEVISGRHRLDKAQREGVDQIWAQVHKESEGFTRDMAAALDAMLNIRDGQGSVADYAQFFKAAGLTKDAADRAGLLARGKGKSGFAIARDASPDLLASHRAGNLSDEAALVISSTAPGSERLQALGIAAVQEGKTLLYASNLMRSVDMMAAERMMAGEQGDIFGFDDSALKEASAMAKKASSKQRAISEQIAAVSGASKRPELARKMGVNVEDPAAVQAKIIELKNEQYLWDNWPLYPELVKQLRGEVMKQGEVDQSIIDQYSIDPEQVPVGEWAGRMMFHGTSTEGAISITGEGINNEKSNSGYFGPGIYLASDHTLARDNYAEFSDDATGGKVVAIRIKPDARILDLRDSADWDTYVKYSGGGKDVSRPDFDKQMVKAGIDGLFDRSFGGVVIYNPKAVEALKLGGKNLFQDSLKPETPAEAAARDQVAAEIENRKAAGEKDLIIQHNVTGANLLHAARMGGIPVPSLAITKAKDSMTSFGEITLLGDAAMADPLGYAKTKVFGADIYSPRYPDISYKLDTKALKKLNEALAPFRQEGEREIYGAEITKPGDLIGNKAFDRYSEANFRDESSSYVDRNAAATAILQSTGAQERIFQGFTESGNRRYKPHTIENIVNILKKDLRGGEGVNYGVGSLRAKFTPQFRSVAQIKANKDRLLSKADFEKVKKEVDENLMEIWNDLAPYSSRGKEFGFGDTVIAVLEDAKTMGIDRALKEYDITDVPQETKQAMAEFLTKLRNLPTEYFEAKITRAVDLAEFRGAVVPDNTSPQILDLLKSRGVEIATYPKGDDGARKAAVAALSAKRTDILFQDNQKKDWYRSALGEAINTANIKSAAAQGWLDMLKGQVAKGGVKADEIKWSGVEDWLKLQEGKVTKEQVADYLASNGVKVEEVDVPEGKRAVDRFGAGLVLPGGENYRELLLTLPKREGVVDNKAIAALTTEWNSWREARNIPPVTADAIPRATWDRLTEDEQRYTYDFRERWDSANEAAKREAGVFQSSHFDQPNILAHIRFNERTDAEGKKVLFVEEIQSDWAQKGKKEGFARAPDASTPEQLIEARARAGEASIASEQSWPAAREVVKQYIGGRDANRANSADLALSKMSSSEDIHGDSREWQVEYGVSNPDHVAIIRKAIADANEKDRAEQIVRDIQERSIGKQGVPAAPFVGKTDAWVSLAMKRMIRYAAENGFDKVAWTRGEQQVERYSSALRKQVDVIEWKKTPEGVQLVGYKNQKGQAIASPELRGPALDAVERNDNLGFDSRSMGLHALWEARSNWRQIYDIPDAADQQAIQKYLDDAEAAMHRQRRDKVVDTTEKEDALSDSIGKAMADQIRNDPNQTGTIEGDQITVSDTGMAGFYDKIVPKVAKDVLKKLGGGKVEELVIPDRTKDQYAEQVYGRGTTYDSLPQTSKDAVDRSIAKSSTNQSGFDITPAMREGAMAGQPLFQKQTDQLHRGSYDIAAKLITTLEGADKSTVVHELGHHWLEDMKVFAARDDAPPSIKADWETLRKELAIGENGEISRASHEQFARSVERYLAEGEAPSRELQGVFARFREWLLDIYKSVMNLNVEINPELRQVLDRMLATDEEIAAARDLGVPRAYVPEAAAAAVEAMVPTTEPKAAGRQINPGMIAEKAAIEGHADELPPGAGEAPNNIHVNYEYMDSPLKVKLALQKIAEVDQENIQKHRGGKEGVESWQQEQATMEAALLDTLGGGPDKLGVLRGGETDTVKINHRLRAMNQLMKGAVAFSETKRDAILAAGHDATILQQLEYLGAIERVRMLQAEFLGERAAVARAMNSLKDSSEGSGEIGRMLEAIGIGNDGKLFQDRTPAEEQAFLKAKLDEIMQRYIGKKKDANGKTVYVGTVLDIAKLHKEVGTLKGTFKLAKAIEQATTWEMVVEGWKASLLSGPVTHTTNMFGTEAFHQMRPAVDALAAIIGMARGASPGMGESDRASMSEAVARLTGMLGGVQDGIKVAIAEFKADEATGKTEAYRTAIPGQAGRIIRTPLRLMGAEDALVTTMYTRGEIRTLAIRQAFDEDLNPSTREFAERVSYLQDNPTPEMQVAAETAATRMTFNAPLGEKGVALQGFVNKWNLQWMIPFIRTPINIAKELLRMSPFAPAIGEWRQAFAKGGVERDRALAEMALGSGIMAITMAYAFSNDDKGRQRLTGSGGPDPGKNRGKAGVWQPYSILIGDTYYEYARIQPTGTLMGMAADMAAVWDHMTDEEKDKVPKMLSTAFAQAITNQTFLQGIANFVNALSDPTRFGPRFLQSMAGSMVPNIIGQPTTMADPVVREVNSALEAIQARIPGMRQDLLPKRDWLGEPVPAKERLGVVMPIREQEISDDKVRLEAARLDISMAAAPKKTHIGKGTGKLGDVKLTPEEQDKFEQVGGEFAHGILQNIVNAPGYDQMPDMVKRKVFSNVLTAAHRVAAVQALPMEKRIAYLQEITEKVQQELTPGDAP